MAAYFGRLRACTLTAASWLHLHVCPLGTLELEGVGTAARADLDKHLVGHLVDVAWHTIHVLHLMLHHEHRPSATAWAVTPKFGSKRDPAAGGGLTVYTIGVKNDPSTSIH